jgi:deazaflavin-dependent oxidoreductase (nitroreductase family)
MHASFRRRYLDILNRTLNPLTLAAAKRGRGPFSVIRHVGRKTGRTFETPVILAGHPDGFIAELTYGPGVNWYRNITHSGGEIEHLGATYRILSVESLDPGEAVRAFTRVQRVVLRVLRRRDFRLIRTSPVPSDPRAWARP